MKYRGDTIDINENGTIHQKTTKPMSQRDVEACMKNCEEALKEIDFDEQFLKDNKLKL